MSIFGHGHLGHRFCIIWPMNASQKIAKNLRKIRKTQGLSQEKAAEKIGLTLRYYAMIESKKPRQVRVSTLEKLAKGLKVPLEKLLK